jgi:hypothetical protein
MIEIWDFEIGLEFKGINDLFRGRSTSLTNFYYTLIRE